MLNIELISIFTLLTSYVLNTYVLSMKTLFFVLLLAMLAAAFVATYFVNKEQRSMNRLSDTFLNLIRKFDSWQMMR